MNDTYTFEAMRRISRRSAILHAQLTAFHDWFDAQSDDDEPETWARSWGVLSTEQQDELIRIKGNTLSAVDFARLDELLARFGEFTLGSEDANYLAYSRSKLYDAMLAARAGHLDDAVAHAQGSADRLDWLINQRKRRSPQHFRHFTPEVRASMLELHRDVSETVERFTRVRAA